MKTKICLVLLTFTFLHIVGIAHATPFTFTYETTLTSTNIPGTSVNGTFTLDVIVDNGGIDLLNQTWGINDVTSAVATSGSYTATFGAPHQNYPYLFKTDSSGELIGAQFANLYGNNSHSFGSGSPKMSINEIFFYSGTPYSANFAEGNQHNLSVWTGPTSSPVPEPTAMLLFGTGLIGLAGITTRRRKK